MKPYDFIDKAMTEKMTMKWDWWALKEPTQEDVEASRMPSESASEAPEDDHESICLACAFNQLHDDYENVQAEISELRNAVEHLTRMLGGK